MQRKGSEGVVSHALLQNELFWEKGAARTGVLLQLFVTHGITSGIALAIVFGLTQLKISSSISIIGVIIIGGGLGLLLTANISYALHRIEGVVTSISQGRSATLPTFSWPLSRLFTLLQNLDRRVQIYIQGEQAAVEIRRHYLQQASETATQTERQRIARDLHDSIKQQLFSMSVSAAAAKAHWSRDTSKAQAAIADIQRVAKEAQVEMQALLQQLGSTPLENVGLANALRTQAEALQYRCGLEMKLILGDLPPDELLPVGTQETIFRLVQEAFSNIARHARAQEVTVTLQQTEKALHLIVCDDGKGFDANRAHAGMGLTNMHERVATLDGNIEVQSAPDQGTRLHVLIPFIQIQPALEDLARSERAFIRGIERAKRGFLVGNTALMITIAFIFSNFSKLTIQIPIIAIGICILVACYGLQQGHSWRVRVIALKGKEHLDVIELQQKEDVFLMQLLNSLLMGGWYVLLAQNIWGAWEVSLFLVLGVLFTLLQVGYYWRAYQVRERKYRLMDLDEARIEISYRRHRLTRYTRFGVSAAIAVVVGLGRFLLSPQTNMTRWVILPWLVSVLPILGCILLFQFIGLRQRQRALEKRTQKGVLESLLGSEMADKKR